ncbi:MAG: RagB/SusD family nutrient uptake outer membrane protein, partial [Candidatus Cryptobacteroides sp.]
LDGIIPLLPVSYAEFATGRTNRITRGAAMALKARVLLYDASPLHNPTGDKTRYEKAAAAAKAVIDSGWYTLVNEKKINNFDAKGYIFGVIRSASNGLESSNFPIGVEGGNSGTCPSQNLAEAFDLLDGTPFDWDNPSHRAIALDPSKRDPRFGETLYVNGSLFKNKPLEMWYGGQNAQPKTGATPTSYYLKKNIIEETSFVTGNAISYPHIYPIIRYAEMYLIYAEALYEASGSHSFKGSLSGVDYTMSPLEALNAVRKRAGVGTLASVTDFREAVRKENRVEFAFENHRFWDTRRWKIRCGDTQIYGLSLVKDEATGTVAFTKTLVQTRKWEDKYYLYPYSDSERYKNSNLQVNPGW